MLPSFAHQGVESLGVVTVLAGTGRSPNHRQALQGIGSPDQQVEAEEGVAVTRLCAWVAERGRG
jgi:hypothetical protein